MPVLQQTVGAVRRADRADREAVEQASRPRHVVTSHRGWIVTVVQEAP